MAKTAQEKYSKSKDFIKKNMSWPGGSNGRAREMANVQLKGPTTRMKDNIAKRSKRASKGK